MSEQTLCLGDTPNDENRRFDPRPIVKAAGGLFYVDFERCVDKAAAVLSDLELKDGILVDSHVDSLAVPSHRFLSTTNPDKVNGLGAVHIPKDAKGLTCLDVVCRWGKTRNVRVAATASTDVNRQAGELLTAIRLYDRRLIRSGDAGTDLLAAGCRSLLFVGPEGKRDIERFHIGIVPM